MSAPTPVQARDAAYTAARAAVGQGMPEWVWHALRLIAGEVAVGRTGNAIAYLDRMASSSAERYPRAEGARVAAAVMKYQQATVEVFIARRAAHAFAPAPCLVCNGCGVNSFGEGACALCGGDGELCSHCDATRAEGAHDAED